MVAALGIDVGTTNVKVALVGTDGTVHASAQRPLATDRRGDVAEQDADAMWVSTVDAVREVTAADPAAAAEVAALGVCSQYSSVVPVDERAHPIAPMIMWQDQRGTEQCFDILGRDENAFFTWVERHGIPPIGGGLSLAHILYLQHARPDIHLKTSAYVEAMDYITARMTGRITASQHSTYMFQLCDNRRLGVTHYDSELVALAGVDPERLPPLVRVDSPVGTLLPDVAAVLGLPDTTTVYAGTNDTATVAVATAADTDGHAGLSIGTTSVLVTEIDRFQVDLEHQLFSMPGPFPDGYVVCAENGLGGKVLEHVLSEIVYADDELGSHGTDDAFAQLDRALRATTPGAGGVMFLPWLNGALAPGGDSNIRGGFVHMSLETGRRDMIRAVAEGIAHNLAWLLPHIETFGSSRVNDVTIVGGAARSAAWCGILADVLNRPVLATAMPERAIARGTALLALHRHGTLTRAELSASVDTHERYEPNPEHHDRYAHRQVQFEAAYAALLPISEALS